MRAMAVFALFLWAALPIGMVLWRQMKASMRVAFVLVVLLPALAAIALLLPLLLPWRL